MSKTEARLIGPEEELGDNVRQVEVYGQTIGREWTPVELNGPQAEKLRLNRYFDVRGAPEADTPEEQRELAAEMGREDALRARLAELGETVKPNASPEQLERQLDRAEHRAAQEAAKAEQGA